MNERIIFFLVLLITLLTSCSTSSNKSDKEVDNKLLSFIITNLSDKEYPDNPDLGFRSINYQSIFFTEGKIDSTSDTFKWDFSFFTKNLDTFLLSSIDISELIPTIPLNVRPQQYLSYISCINQEWNRNQIQFNQDKFSSTLSRIVRIDLTRNCLSAYLWEVVIFVNEDGKELPYAHGWFDFPQKLYAQLFEKKNNIPFAVYKKPLENWVDPESKKIDMDILRTVIDKIETKSRDLSNQMYPMAGERKKKYKEIIHPENFTTMRDLQSDSTLFATFSSPGFYDKQDPRKTELGRFYHLKNVELYKIKTNSSDDTLYEIELKFEHRVTGSETKLIIGGIDLKNFPILSENKANKGWENSMGIGNHSFYEVYKEHIDNKSKNSSYYAMLLDEKGKWLDSHEIGVDGPIFHFSDPQRKILHLWLLSFERHALVGHYEIIID